MVGWLVGWSGVQREPRHEAWLTTHDVKMRGVKYNLAGYTYTKNHTNNYMLTSNTCT